MTRIVVEKPTCFWRSRLLVVDPHSMSMVPFWTSVMRLAEVTACQPTSRPGLPVCLRISARMALDRSTEKPIGLSGPAR